MIRSKLFWLLVMAIVLLGAILAAGNGEAAWLKGWLSYSFLLGLVTAILYVTWRLVIGRQIDRSLLFAVVIALLLRLWVGTALTQLLPVIGYSDSQEHQAGYAFTDAYLRDEQAWQLANSESTLDSAFSGQYSSDQYGGMLFLEAFLYRTFSLDTHRQMLVLTLTAGAAAWGVIFLWKASHEWFGRRIAQAAAWLFALYPESVLLGSSQMREAFVISAIAIMFYSLTRMHAGEKKTKGSLSWLGWLALCAVILILIQPPILIVALLLLSVLWLLDPQRRFSKNMGKSVMIGVILMVLLCIALLVAASTWANLPSLRDVGVLRIFTDWLVNNFNFQSYLTERASGMFQKLIESVGEQWTWLVVMVYGIAQPVLPAMVGDPDAAAIMRLIGFLRAAGWYLLAPFLVYGMLAAIRVRGENRRAQLIIMSVMIWGWAIIAAFNGGADQWDTPRYRTLLLACQVLIAAWAWNWARLKRDAWLGRWLAIEGIFIAMFTEWYASRYYTNLPHFDIFLMIAITLLLTLMILVGGWWIDRKKKLNNQSNEDVELCQ